MKNAFLLYLFFLFFVAFVSSCFFMFGFLKRTQGSFASRRSNVPWLAAAGYFGPYVAMAALSLRGRAIGAVTGFVYPTLAEANTGVAGERRRTYGPQRLLLWVARYHASTPT
jgi:hypothetical protein